MLVVLLSSVQRIQNRCRLIDNYKRPAEQISASLTSVHTLMAAKQASVWPAVHEGGCPAHPFVSVRVV